jgi:hypothetical protein
MDEEVATLSTPAAGHAMDERPLLVMEVGFAQPMVHSPSRVWPSWGRRLLFQYYAEFATEVVRFLSP